MPNRLLHETCLTSDSLNRASEQAELLFYRLMLVTDDFGRFDARPAVLRARCFPLRLKDWSEGRISRALEELEEVGTVRLYEVEGRHYGWFPTWDKRQRVRAAASKYPSPDGAPPTDDGHMTASRGSRDDSDLDFDGVRGFGGKGAFEHFYGIFPPARKGSRREVLRAWVKAVRRAKPDDIIAAAERYRDDPNREDAYTCGAARWLNRDGWEEGPLPPRLLNRQAEREARAQRERDEERARKLAEADAMIAAERAEREKS